jgi:hypothetical protein
MGNLGMGWDYVPSHALGRRQASLPDRPEPLTQAGAVALSHRLTGTLRRPRPRLNFSDRPGPNPGPSNGGSCCATRQAQAPNAVQGFVPHRCGLANTKTYYKKRSCPSPVRFGIF